MNNDPKKSVLENLTRNGYMPDSFYRAPDSHLVYAPMLKCASTYYDDMFQRNGWQSMGFKDINWEHDFVFGFIMDPYRRHIKALVEDLLWLEKRYQLDIRQLPEEFWQLGPVLGIHGLGFTQIYEEHYDKIYWVPLDADVGTQDILDDLFQKHNISWDWEIDAYEHKSDDDKLGLFNKIYRMFDGPGQDWFNITNRKDVLLYQSVLEKFVKTT